MQRMEMLVIYCCMFWLSLKNVMAKGYRMNNTQTHTHTQH